MKKTIALSTLALIMSASAFADVSQEDSATWLVSAVKDTNQRLVVTPVGSINFQYGPVSETFDQQPAKFNVEVYNADFDAGSTVTAFKLDVRQGSYDGITNGTDTARVGLLFGSTELTTDWTPMVDTSTSLTMTDMNLTGTVTPGETGHGEFTAFLTDFSTTDAASMSDGNYTGSVSADFRATWVGATQS